MQNLLSSVQVTCSKVEALCIDYNCCVKQSFCWIFEQIRSKLSGSEVRKGC